MSLPERYIRQLLLCIVLSIAFYGLWAGFSGVGDVLGAAARIGWGGWAAILGLSLLNYLLRFVRWDMYLRTLGRPVPPGPNLAAYLAGFGFTTTPGKVGEAVRSVYLRPYNVGYTESLAAFFVERLADMLAMVVIAALAAYAFADWRWLLGAALLLTLICLAIVRSPVLPGWLDRRADRQHHPRLGPPAGHLAGLLRTSAVLLRSAPLWLGFGLGLAAWGAEGYALAVVVERMGAPLPVALAAGIYGLAILAGAVSFVPGGLGGTEVVMGSLLVLAGVDAPLAVSAVIICRIATLWFAVAIGLVCVGVLELGRSGRAAAEVNVGD